MKGPGIHEVLYGVGTVSSLVYIVLFLIERIILRYQALPLISTQNPWWFFLSLSFAYLFYFKYHNARAARINGCLPAAVYPHRDRILGTDWVVDLMAAVTETRLLETFTDIFARCGNTFWFQSLGQWSIMTREPENIKNMLSSNFDAWSIDGLRKKTAVLSLGPKAIFSVSGAEWHHVRAQMRPSFVRNQLADLECTDRHVENFLARLPRDGSRVDLQSLFYLFTMDISTDFMFGHSTNMLVNPSPAATEFTKCFETVLLSASSRARMSWLLMLLPDKEYSTAFKKCNEFIDTYISEALGSHRTKERPYIFMNELIESGASPDEIRQQLLSLILGGRDTSAGSMSVLFWHLARRPDIVQKMRNELAELHGEKPSWEQLKNLRYLNMVLKEILRLYPPVFSTMRSATKDVVLPRGGGEDGQAPLFVPKGTQCRFSILHLHRRKDIWGPDADEFRPERWENPRSAWQYIPFSGGPRICIGQQFALTQMMYMVSRILQLFDTIEPHDTRPLQHIVSTTTKLKNGCWVSLKPVAE